MTKPGTHLDTFTLHTPAGPIESEMRLVAAEDGTELIWHYENGSLTFTHRALRCTECSTVLYESRIGSRCLDCAEAAGSTLI